MGFVPSVFVLQILITTSRLCFLYQFHLKYNVKMQNDLLELTKLLCSFNLVYKVVYIDVPSIPLSLPNS